MVNRAEKGLLSGNNPNDETEYSEEQKVLHKPGSLLKKSEVELMYRESGCRKAEIINSCFHSTVNKYRTIDGTCNNLRNRLWGAAHTAFRRLIPSNYEDGISDLRGQRQSMSKSINRGGINIRSGPFDPPFPSARYISQRIVTNNSATERPLTHMVMQWGQFLDHDLDLSPEPENVRCSNCSKTEICQPIRIHWRDPVFGRKEKCMPFKRTIAACTTTPSGRFSSREQVNDLTSYIDGSQIYGSSAKTAKKLRTFRNGLLKTSRGNNLPLTTEDCMMGALRCYLAGDVRANEQVGLTAMHTLWVREHNRIAKELKVMNRRWNDEKLYQETRKIIGAMLQKITYQDYLPKLIRGKLLQTLIPRYKGYNASVDASIPNAFATAAYRYGHSLIRPVFARYLSDNYERGTNRPLHLLRSFFNINAFRETSLGAIFRGLATDNSQRMDESLNSILTTQLFKKGNGAGLDLAALNIQRQRDHGLPSYTVWRNYCLRQFPKLPMAAMRSHALHRQLLQTYGYLENVDFWLGGISEKRVSKSVLGPTFACIFGLTFHNLRDGDRFWYEKPGVFTRQQLREIRRATLAHVICDNTDVKSIQRDVFLSTSRRNRRTKCSIFRKMNLIRWKEQSQGNACYMKVGHCGGLGVPFQTVYKRQGLQYFYDGGSLGNHYGCLKMRCPSSYLGWRYHLQPINIGVRPRTWRGRRYCTIMSINSRLPKNQIRSLAKKYYYYGQGFTLSMINGYTGMYRSLTQCRRGLYTAITYRCTAGAKNIHLQEDEREEDTLEEENGELEMMEQEKANVLNNEEVKDAENDEDPYYEEESSNEMQDDEYNNQEYMY